MFRTKKIIYNGILHVVQRGNERDFWEGRPDLGYASEGTWEDIC